MKLNWQQAVPTVTNKKNNPVVIKGNSADFQSSVRETERLESVNFLTPPAYLAWNLDCFSSWLPLLPNFLLLSLTCLINMILFSSLANLSSLFCVVYAVIPLLPTLMYLCPSILVMSFFPLGMGLGGNSPWGRRCAKAFWPLEGVWFRHHCGPGASTTSRKAPGRRSPHRLWQHVLWVHAAAKAEGRTFWTFSLNCTSGSSACTGAFPPSKIGVVSVSVSVQLARRLNPCLKLLL